MNLLAKIALFILIFTSMSTQARIAKCVGMDSEGNTINLLLDPKTDTANINNSIFKIDGETKNREGVVTENYIAEDGQVVYVSILPHKRNKLILVQFNAVTDKVIATATLACHYK